MNWEDRTEVKKGDIGERILDEYLISIGIIPYVPVAEGAHPFDRLCASRDKKTIWIADAKTKPRRLYYPDTGINYKSFHEYMFIKQKHSIDIFLYFVDEVEKLMYGGLLSVISAPKTVQWKGKVLEYPLKQGAQIYFPLCLMKRLKDLTDLEVEEIAKFTTRKYDYEVKPHGQR